MQYVLSCFTTLKLYLHRIYHVFSVTLPLGNITELASFRILCHLVRKIISIILLGCLFIYESGYMLLYVFQLLEVKQEMQAYIRNHPKEHGQFFTFQVKNGDVADKSFSWEEEPEEFSYKGRMYDVVDIKTSGDKLFIHAYNDQKEEQLQADLARHHKQKHNPALNQLISLVFIHPQNEAVSQDHTLNLVHTNITKTEKLHSVELAIQSPPPEIV